MVKIRLLLVLALAVLTINSAKPPAPFCQSRPILKELPLTYEEKLATDMAQLFSGYNLDIELASNNSFVKINKKFIEVDRMNTYLQGLIAHHIEHKDNDWGK